MINSIDAARAICQIGDWRVSNLSLHKMLYIAHGTYMAEKGGEKYPLIDDWFYAWDYGPVEPGLYHKFKMFGSDFIKEYALTMKYTTNNPDEKIDEIKHIKKVIGWLAACTPSQLITMTHIHGGAWRKHYVPRESNIIIPDIEIYNEYNKY